MSKMTHTGIVSSHWIKSRPVELRETKTFWIEKGGNKYRKATGSLVGGDSWACTSLKLESIKEIQVTK